MTLAFFSLLMVLVICCVVLVLVIIQRKSGSSKHRFQRPTKSSFAKGVFVPPAPILTGMSFRDVMEGSQLPVAMKNLAKKQIECAFGFDLVNATIQTISFENSSLKMVYEFSKHGNQLLSSHEAIIPLTQTGHKLLPMLQDAQTGKVIEFAKGSTDYIGRAAQVASIVTSVAHIISSMDVVTRLKEIDRKLNILVAGRKNDQLAELEATYDRIREAFSRPDWSSNPGELRDCRHTLRRLRSVWRRDLESLVDSSPDTLNSLGFERFGGEWRAVINPLLFGVQKATELIREGGEKKLYLHLTPLAILVGNLRVALMLDILVVQALGDVEVFRETVSSEDSMWQGIDAKVAAAHSKIRTYGNPEELQTIQGAITGYKAFLTSLST